MDNLTQEQIENIIYSSKGNISDMNCRYLAHFMIGYLKNATNIENVRQDFYREVYENLKDGKEKL